MSVQERSKSAPRAPQEGPRGFQEALKRLLEGFRVEDEIGNRFGTRSGLVFGGPGASQFRFSCKMYCIFRDFAFFNLDPIGNTILDLPGLPFWSALAPKIVETSLEIPLGAPKSRSKDLFFGPGGLQERSKRPPRGLQPARTAPRALQEASGSILEPFGSHSGSHFGTIWGQV